MATRRAGASLDRIAKSLAEAQEAREFLLRNTREIVILSSRSIVAVHKEDLGGARSRLQDAARLLKEYRGKAKGDLKRYLVVPEQEFAEASALLAVAEKRQIPARGSLQVSDEAYVLGLLDCIGEMKRLILDRIRRDRLPEALAAFQTMEDLFSLLYPFAGLDKVVKDARRKLDVGRILVEDARSVITQEIRRKDLVDAMARLEKR